MSKVEVIDNRDISAVYHAGDLAALIKRASIVRQSMNIIAKRNPDNRVGARTLHEYRVDPSYDDYKVQCDEYVTKLQNAFNRMVKRGNQYRAAVIIIHNYAVELLVADM